MIEGIVNFDKPAGLSSAAVVSQVKRLLPRGTKIGHAGTLDPFATGVLLLLVGRATRQCERLMGATKEYITTVKLGATTETDDPESPEIAFPVPAGTLVPPDLAAVTDALGRFVGTIQQVPPVYSALKRGGRRACDLVREGRDVVLEPRTVRVDAIGVLSYTWPCLKLKITCGRGTYIRSIARDLGTALNVGGYLTELRRTRIGPFGVDDAVSLDRLRQEGIDRHLLPVAGIGGTE